MGPVWALSSCQLQSEVLVVSDALFVQPLAVVSIVGLRCSLWSRSPLSLTADHCLQPLLPLLCCGAVLRGRWGPCRLLMCIRL